MNIQSISIVVPAKGCINNCKFCVSRMHESPYENKFDEIAYRKRIKYASMNNVNTMILTGTGEALQNREFLYRLSGLLKKENHPFPNVELQTSGVLLQKEESMINGSSGELEPHYPNVALLEELGVNTISLSVSDIFDSKNNWDIIGSPPHISPSLVELTQFIKEMGFNLRLSLNMTNVYDDKTPQEILRQCKKLGADQITFRKLYHSNDDSDQTKWVKENACKDKVLKDLNEYIAGVPHHNNRGDQWVESSHGTPLYRLPFGPMAYSIMGMSTVVDDNCMNKESYDQLKYVILRENGRLYCQWDDEGSLIF